MLPSSAPVQARRQYALFFLLVAGVAAAGAWVGLHRRAAPDVLSAVPEGAWLVARIDAAALRASPLVQPLLGAGPGAATVLPGLGPLADACGFDPLARLDQIVVCSPEGGERGDFGVGFTGQFTREELTRCAETISRARGSAPAAITRGEFTVLEDAAHTRFAYRQGGPFLIGRGAWLDAMIDAVERGGRVAAERPEHAALRAALAAKPGEAPRAVVITALLPKAVRERLRAELGAQVSEAGASDRAYASVLAVASAGFALGTAGPGSTTDLAVELRCDTEGACADVKTLIERKRLSLSRDLGVRLGGIGPLLDSLTIGVQAGALSATAHAPTDDLARAVKRVLDLRSPPRDSLRALPKPPAPDGGP